MAAQNQIDILITAQNQTQAALSKIKSDVHNIGGSVKQINTEFHSAHAGLNKIAGVITTLTQGFVLLQGMKVFQNIAGDAARAETLATVLHVVARNAGITREAVDAVDKSVQKLGITAQTSRESLSQFIKSGLDVKSAASLARAAQDLAVLSGGNSSDTFRDLTTAVDEMSIVMLRFRGINVTNEEAQARYAAQVGKSVSSLEDWEKKQALLNLVLERSTRLTGIYEASMGDVAKQVSSLDRFQTEAATSMGQSLLPAYSAVVLELTNFLRNLKLTADEMNATGDGGKSLGKTVGDIAQALRLGTEFVIDHRDAIFGAAKAYIAFKAATAGMAAFKGVQTALMGGMVSQVNKQTGETEQVKKAGLIPTIANTFKQGGAVSNAAGQTAEAAAAARYNTILTQRSALEATAKAQLVARQAAHAEEAAIKARINQLQASGTAQSRAQLIIEQNALIVATGKVAAKRAELSTTTSLIIAERGKQASAGADLMSAGLAAAAARSAGRAAPLTQAGSAMSIFGSMSSMVGKVIQGVGNLLNMVAGLVGGWRMLTLMGVGYWLIMEGGYTKISNKAKEYYLMLFGSEKELSEHRKKMAKEQEERSGIKGYKEAIGEQKKAEMEARKLEYQEARIAEDLKSSTDPAKIEEREQLKAEIAEKKRLAKEKSELAQSIADEKGIKPADQAKLVSQAEKEAYTGGVEFDQQKRMMSLNTTRQNTGANKQVYTTALPISVEASTAFELYRKEFSAYAENLPGADASMSRLMYSTQHFVDSLKSVSDGIVLMDELNSVATNTERTLGDLESIKWGKEQKYDAASQGKEAAAYAELKKQVDEEVRVTGKPIDEVVEARKKRTEGTKAATEVTSVNATSALTKTFGLDKMSDASVGDKSALLGAYNQAVKQGTVSKEQASLIGDNEEAKILAVKKVMAQLRDEIYMTTANSMELMKQEIGLKNMENAISSLTQKTKLYSGALEKVSELLMHHHQLSMKMQGSSIFKAEGAGASTLKASRMVEAAKKEYDMGMAKVATAQAQRKKIIDNERNSLIGDDKLAMREQEEAAVKAKAEKQVTDNKGETAKYKQAAVKIDTGTERSDLVAAGFSGAEFDAKFAEAELSKYKASEKTGVKLKDDKVSALETRVAETKRLLKEEQKAEKEAFENDPSEMDGGVVRKKKMGKGEDTKIDSLAKRKVDTDTDRDKEQADEKKAADRKVTLHQEAGARVLQINQAAQAQMTASTRMEEEERLHVSKKYYDSLVDSLSEYQEGYITKINAIRDINKGMFDVVATQSKASISAEKTAESLKFTPDAARMGQLDAAQQRTDIGAGKGKYDADVAAMKQALEQKIRMVEDSNMSEKAKQEQITSLNNANLQERLAKDKDYFQTLAQSRDAALQKYQEYATKAKELEKSIRDEAISDAAAIRDIDRTGKSDTFKYQDKKKEMQEYYSLAKQMAADGDLDGAKQYAEKGKGLARGLAGAPGVGISQGRDDAKEGFSQGMELTQGINSANLAKNKSAAEEQKKIYLEMTDAVNNMASSLKKLSADAEIKLNPTLDDAKLKELQNELKRVTAEQDASVNVILAEGSLKGIVDSIHSYFDTNPIKINIEANVNGSGATSTNAPTPEGTVSPQMKAEGGLISGIGTGTSDNIPAMLSHGEFILKQDATAHYGTNFLNLLNSKALRFAEGGWVSTGEKDDNGVDKMRWVDATEEPKKAAPKKEEKSNLQKLASIFGVSSSINKRNTELAEAGKYAEGGWVGTGEKDENGVEKMKWLEPTEEPAKVAPKKEEKSNLQKLASIFGVSSSINKRNAALAEAGKYADGGWVSTGEKDENGVDKMKWVEATEEPKKAPPVKRQESSGLQKLASFLGVTSSINKRNMEIAEANKFSEGGNNPTTKAKQISDSFKNATGVKGSKEGFLDFVANPSSYELDQDKLDSIKAAFPTMTGILKAVGVTEDKYPGMRINKKTVAGYAEGGDVEKEKTREEKAKEISDSFKKSGSLQDLIPKPLKDLLKGSKKHADAGSATIGVRGATGGFNSSGDIPAWVSNGEFRMSADAVSHYGSGVLNAINDMAFPKFADGGMIGAANSVINNENLGTNASVKDIVEVAFRVNDKVHALQGSKQTARDLAKSLQDYSMRNLG